MNGQPTPIRFVRSLDENYKKLTDFTAGFPPVVHTLSYVNFLPSVQDSLPPQRAVCWILPVFSRLGRSTVEEVKYTTDMLAGSKGETNTNFVFQSGGFLKIPLWKIYILKKAKQNSEFFSLFWLTKNSNVLGAFLFLSCSKTPSMEINLNFAYVRETTCIVIIL